MVDCVEESYKLLYLNIKGQNSVYPSKFQEFFNLNPKILKLTIYPPEVSRSDNLNISLKFFVKMDGN
jgi:hypothetical protein